MGRAASTLLRKLANVGVQRRAERLLEKERATAAAPPRYPGERRLLDRLAEERPELMAAVQERSGRLVERMHRLRVTKDVQSRPADQAQCALSVQGEPGNKLALADVYRLLQDAEKCSQEQLADKYAVRPEAVDALVRHYGIFTVGTDEQELPPVRREDLGVQGPGPSLEEVKLRMLQAGAWVDKRHRLAKK